MALKKDFSEGTKYYYIIVKNFVYEKDDAVRFEIERLVRDTSDPDVGYTETNQVYQVEVNSSGSGLPDTNDRWSFTNLEVEGKNHIAACYDWLKSDIEEFKTGWTDV